jgi:hypothetical protein
MPVEKRGTELILKVTDATADRRFMNMQGPSRLAEAPVVGGRNKIAQMTELNNCYFSNVWQPESFSKLQG